MPGTVFYTSQKDWKTIQFLIAKRQAQIDKKMTIAESSGVIYRNTLPVPEVDEVELEPEEQAKYQKDSVIFVTNHADALKRLIHAHATTLLHRQKVSTAHHPRNPQRPVPIITYVGEAD